MKLTRESLEKSLELLKINLDLGYDQARMPTEDYIALVQAHFEMLEGLECIVHRYRGNSKGQENCAREMIKKHGGVE